MAAGDATPVPRYGVAYRVTFPILDADGDLVTGASSLDSEVSIDGGTFADATAEATEIGTSSGMYYLDLSAAEMTGSTIAVIVKTGTAGAKTTPIVLYPRRDTEYGLKRTGTAQAGSTTTITLDASASATDDFYVGDFILCEIDGVVDGLVCSDYVGSTKVATMEAAWKGGIAPDSNDPFWIFAGSPGISAATIAAAVHAATMGAGLGALSFEQAFTKIAARILGNSSGLTSGAGTLVDKDWAGTDAVSQVISNDGNKSGLDLSP